MSATDSRSSRRAGARTSAAPLRPIALALLFAAGQLAFGQFTRLIRGKVVMEDGSRLPKPARVERTCGGRVPVHVASTNAKGEFSWEEAGYVESFGACTWRAVLPGWESTTLDMETIQKSANVPDFVLHRARENVPPEAATRWNRAMQAIAEQRWTDAESDLRPLSSQFPQTGPIWTQLGFVLAGQERLPEARQAYRRSIQAAPWYLPAYHRLAMLDASADDLSSAALTLEEGLKKRASAILYLDQAGVRYSQRDYSGAEYSALQAIALDAKRELPRAEYVLGIILASGEDQPAAATHLRRFLEIAPDAPEAESARTQLRALESGDEPIPQEPLAPSMASADPDLEPDANGEVGVPGGVKALAVAARLDRTPAPADFFLEFCRAIAQNARTPGRGDIPDFVQAVESYLSAVVEISHISEDKAQSEGGEQGQLVLSTDTVANYAVTKDILRLFGWRPVPNGEAGFEPSEQATDSARQLVPMALGIDETEMFRSLADRGAFRIEIRNGRAPLVEAGAWRSALGRLPPGGFAEAFLRNPRFALTYIGLGSMSADAAAVMTGGIGLRTLTTRYADLIAFVGKAFAVENGRVAVPGGTAAEPVWQRLAGANPADPKAFFRALLEKDQGRLAAFYLAVWRGDEAHRRFFMRDGAAARYYAWYRGSPELRNGASETRAGWRQALFRDLPLDAAGSPLYPGGKAAWIDPARPEDEALAAARTLEALAPVAALERTRGAPLDAESARLLAQHYPAWRALFPYFEKLPALGVADFRALASFETSASARPAAVQNAVMGEWHALVKLIELGARSGALDQAAAARAFRAACESLSGQDHAGGAIAALRSFAPGPDLEEGVQSGLLRLADDRREAYRQVREIQGAPLLSAPDLAGDAVLRSLSGAVYAALLDPNVLLVAEDPGLPVRHKYTVTPSGPALFAPSELVLCRGDQESFFAGGFMAFEQAAKNLARAGALQPESRAEIAAAAPAPERLPAASALAAVAEAPYVFRASARVVEVYATVTNAGGDYIDDLQKADFRITDAGVPVEIGAFENYTAGVSVALMLDTTGSMVSTLPALRSSAFRLVDNLRPVDSVAVYSFNSRVTELQPFTRNRDLAKRAVVRTHASGFTGLYDALTRVARDLSGRSGKKVIVVFTDGRDNASALTRLAAMNRAKHEGVPVYTIAQGDAVDDSIAAELGGLAAATGGLSFAIRRPEEIRGVFDHISRDLRHGYLLAFQPPPDTLHKWRSLSVTLRSRNGNSVRARQGYYPD